MDYKCILQVRKDPRLVNTGLEKVPKYVIPEKPNVPMSDKGIYMMLEKDDKKT